MVTHTKVLVASCIVALACRAIAAQTSAVADSSLLRPSDRSYAEATEFARFLDQHDIAVRSIHRSKREGSFRGVDKAALFKTDRGILEVIFFPDKGAEKVSATERRDGQRYIYTFTGQPQPNPPTDTINAAYPEYFLMHRGWFIVTNDEKLYSAVKSVL